MPTGSRLWTLGFVLPVLLLALWQVASVTGFADQNFLPPLQDLATRFLNELRAGTLAEDLGLSLLRDLAGFVIGSLIGVGLGLVLGFSPLAARIVGPSLLVHRQIALFAWVPLISVWFGAGEIGKVAFIAFAAFQPNVINTWQGVAAIPAAHVELARALTFRRLDFIRFIALPGALPAIFTGLHAGLIYAWQATIAAELFMTIAPGLGGRLMEGRQLFQMDLVLVAILLMGVIGIIFNKLAALAERRLVHGRGK
ncbi:ABC transporter permease [Dongia rigui]|uniref:ABC transporter permease n=1 Tax=Dongia rigui TaxID=940149 RepID=A0ABU5DXL5_9PROT|nr:ABC transporter permease [Dongia rigui]MDY0872061.1 ABC transporter permease [Dongia rigui]